MIKPTWNQPRFFRSLREDLRPSVEKHCVELDNAFSERYCHKSEVDDWALAQWGGFDFLFEFTRSDDPWGPACFTCSHVFCVNQK